MNDRFPPSSLDMEKSVIGCMLNSKSAIETAMSILTADDFNLPHHQVIFDTICILYKNDMEVDYRTVSEDLDKREVLDKCGGIVYLLQIDDVEPTSDKTESYARVVLEKSVFRKVIDASNRIIELAYNPDTTIETIGAESLSAIQQALNTRRAAGLIGPKEIADIYYDFIEERSENQHKHAGISTGIPSFDYMLQGLQKEDLIIIAGRPSTGKSALSMDILANVALKYRFGSSIIFSAEMSMQKVTNRIASKMARVDSRDLLAGRISREDESWTNVGKAMAEISESSLYISELTTITPSGIRTGIRERLRHGPVHAIVVDYLQKLEADPGPRNESGFEKVGRTCGDLKNIAREFKIPVILCSQFNRSLSARTDKRPVMTDLESSGKIEQHADVIIALYRDSMHQIGKEYIGEDDIMEALFLKQREGPVGTVYLKYNMSQSRFWDCPENEEPEGRVSYRKRGKAAVEPVPPPEAPDRFAPESPMRGWGEK